MNLKNFKIRTQLKLGFAILLLLVLVLGVISYIQSNKIYIQVESMYDHPLKVRRAIGMLRSDIISIQRDMKDLFLAADEKEIAQNLNRIEIWKTSVFEQIDILYSQYLGPHADIDSVKQAFVTWNSIREVTIRLLRAGKTREAANSTKTLGFEENQMEVLLKGLGKIDIFAINKTDSLIANSREVKDKLTRQLILLLVAILLLSFLIIHFLLRNIRKPIEEITDAATRFHNGDMDARSSYALHNEFGVLSDSFNTLAENIQLNIKNADIEKRDEKKRVTLLADEQNHELQETHIATLNLLEDLKRENEARKKSEEALRESESRYRNLVELLPDGIVVHSEGKVIYANSAAARIISASGPDKLFGVSFIEYVHPDYREIAINRIKMAFMKNSTIPLMEEVFVKIDGTRINVEVTSIPFLYMGKKAMLTVFNDITERKRTEVELRESEEKFRSIMEQTGDLIAITDNNGFIIFASSASRSLFNFVPEEMCGHFFVEFLHGSDIPKAIAMFLDVSECGKDTKNLELKMKRKDGSFFVGELNGSIFQYGALNGALLIIHDITERKQIQEQLKMLNAELEQRVIERTARLHETFKELETFSYSVSHDLRAPLRAIDGFTGILLEVYEPKLDNEGKRLCFKIRENACQMGQLIDDLLSFSRITRTDINISRINMKELAGSVYSELTTPEKRRQIDFQLSELDSVSGDSILLHQVLTNLISNSIKFSAKKEHQWIKISSKKEKKMVVFSIQDNGAGFDMKYIDKIFGVFQRLHSTKEFEGTGVGLAIVHRIITRHGGEVYAEGEVDKGATFYFSLPI